MRRARGRGSTRRVPNSTSGCRVIFSRFQTCRIRGTDPVLFAMAWRNLWRQPRRTLLSLLSIAFAATLLVFMLSFQFGVYAQMKESALRLFDGYAQYQAPGYADDPDLRKTIADPAGLGFRRA